VLAAKPNVFRRVFLSSTAQDLGPHREAVAKAIARLDGFQCVRMEDFGARDWPTAPFCRAKVAECDIFLGLIGHLSGSSPDGQETSFTEQEYDAAVEAGLPLLLFLAKDDLPLAPSLCESGEKRTRQQDFRARLLQKDHVVDFFTAPDPLATQVVTALRNLERELLANRPLEGADLPAYLKNFQQHITTDLAPLIPTRLLRGDHTIQRSDLSKDLAESKVIHLYGASGAGKSHLARHLALELMNEQCLPIIVLGKHYDGDFDSLLSRSVSHLSVASLSSLFSACALSGLTILLVLDGFNECTPHLRDDLAERVKAFLLRVAALVIVTSRPEADSASLLPGTLITLPLLGPEEKERLATYYGEVSRGVLDILRTPFDIRIAAESLKATGHATNQQQLFHAYVRKRLPSASESAFSLLTEAADRMAESLTSTLPDSEIYRLTQKIRGADPDALLASIEVSGLASSSQGYFSFWHEKIQRFFQAEAILRDPRPIAPRLRSPRNEDALEFVIGGLQDSSAVKACIPEIRSEEIFLSMLRGDLGPSAKAALELDARDLLAKARHELGDISIEKGEDPSRFYTALAVISSTDWKDHEYRLMSLLGRAFAEGFFCEEILDLIERTETECLPKVKALYRTKAWHLLYPFLYVGISPRSLPASRMAHALEFGIRHDWSSIARKALAPRFDDLQHQSPGILQVLTVCQREYCWSSHEEPDVESLLPLLRRLIDTNLYHLQLEAAQLAQASGHKLQEPLRSEVESLLETLLGENIMLNSAVIDALSQFRDLQITSLEHAESEIREVLDGPHDEEACQIAAGIFGNILEDPISEHYYTAIHMLDTKDKTNFHVMAALGSSHNDFGLSIILSKLVELGTPETRPAFEKWCRPPQPDGFLTDQHGEIFLLAHIGLARVAEAYAPGASSSTDEESWLTWGEIIFWLHRVGLEDASIREACRPSWKKLYGPLLPASIDPLFQMERHARSYFPDKHLYRAVYQVFPAELREVFQRALPLSSELTSLFGSVYRKEDRKRYMIEELGRFGDETSALMLQSYVESEDFGASAVRAIKDIRGRDRGRARDGTP
jgi:energy-coupling factor transporter ATP-binding protein EcfA2